MSEQHEPMLVDPRTKYDKPTFPEQQQDAPGVESKMQPPCDHGEQSYSGCGRLKGLVALITGGDSGIGRAVALAYAREGAKVAFTYLSEHSDARETERLVETAGQEVASFRMDQMDSNACKDVVDETVRRFGRLDILVNNAAFQRSYASIEDMTDEEISVAFQTNIEAFFYFCRSALKHMKPGAAVINTSSIQAFSPSPGLAPYAATKAAIVNFTLSFAQEAIKKGVRVNSVAPGPVWTPLIPATLPSEKVSHFGANTLFERPAQPAELAPVYVFLASNEASYITGEVYGVTGGRMQM